MHESVLVLNIGGDPVLQIRFFLQFVEDGYLILEDFFSPDQCEEMRKECKRIVDEMNPEEHKEIFSTEAHEQVSWQR